MVNLKLVHGPWVDMKYSDPQRRNRFHAINLAGSSESFAL